MSGDVRRLPDAGGTLVDVVDALHDIGEQLAGLPHALVGGLAVLVHVPGHRVTEDIDSAVRGTKNDIADRLRVVAGVSPGQGDSFTTAGGVPIDVLRVGEKAPRTGIGVRREARAYALRWAIDTAKVRTVTTDPAPRRGPVRLPVAEPAALIAMKCASMADPGRGDKRATDLLDIWRLLAQDPVATVNVVADLVQAPGVLPAYVRARLTGLFASDPAAFVASMATGPGAPTTTADVRDLWTAIIEPGLFR